MAPHRLLAALLFGSSLAGCYDADAIFHAVKGDASGALKHFSMDCNFRTATASGLDPELELVFFPLGGRGLTGRRDHPEFATVTILVPGPPADSTRVGAYGPLAEVRHRIAWDQDLAMTHFAEGAMFYAQGTPIGDRCGSSGPCAIVERELFVEHLRIPEAEHPLPDGSGTFRFAAEITDLRAYCFDDELIAP